MIFDVSIKANSEQMSICFLREQILEEIPGIVTYELSSKRIAAIGKTEQDLQRESSGEWETIKPRLGFARPFDIDEFHLGFAVAMIQYGTYLMLGRIREDASGPRLFDRFKYSLDIDGFDELPIDTQIALKYTLLSETKARSVLIKGQNEAQKWHLQVADWTLRLFGTTGMLLSFLIIWPLLPIQHLDMVTPVVETLIRIIVALSGAYLGFFLMTVLGVSIVRLFVPKTAVEVVFPAGAFPEFVTRWVTNTLLPDTYSNSISGAP